MDNHHITIWQGEINGDENDAPAYWNMLEAHEQQQAALISNPATRLSYIEIHARLRLMLADTINSRPELLRIVKGEFGKPYLADYPELAFNLSHTANKFVIVTGFHHELGADIEYCKPRITLPALVEKCFAEEEQDYWQQLPDQEKTEIFYRFWTRKEAYVKAIGSGIALGLNQCVINPEDHNRFLRLPAGYGHPDVWQVKDIVTGNNFCAAYAARPCQRD